MARNITVTFADGTSHVYQNAPDDVTPDAVEARASKEFGKAVKALDGGRAPTPVNIAPTPGAAPTDRQKLIASFPMRLATGLKDPLDGAAQLLNRGLDKVGLLDPLNKAADFVGGEGTFLGDVLGIKSLTNEQFDAALKKQNDEYDEARKAVAPNTLNSLVTGQKEVGFDGARLLGNVFSPVNLTAGKFIPGGGATTKAIAAKGAASGAVGAASQPVLSGDDFAAEKAKQLGIGAATGGVLAPVISKVGSSVANFVRSKLNSGTISKTPEGIEQEIRASFARDDIDVSQIPKNVMAKLTEEVKGALASGKEVNAAALMRKMDFDRVGVTPTTGQLTRDPNQYTREVNLRGIQGVGEPLSNRFAQQQSQLATRMRDGTSGPNGYEAGRSLIERLQAKDAEMVKGVRSAYTAFKESTGKDLEVPLSGLSQDYAKTVRDFGDTIPKAVRGQFEELGLLSGKQTKLLSIDDAENLIKVINKNFNPADKAQATALNELRGHVQNAILNVTDSGAGMEAATLANLARGSAKDRFSAIDSVPAFKAAINGAEPDDFVRKYVINGKVREINELAKLVGPKGQKTMQQQLLTHLESKAFGANAAGDGAASQAAFNRELKSIGKNKLAALLGEQKADELFAVGRVMSYIQQRPAGSAVNESNTGAAVANLLSKVSGTVKGAPYINDFVIKPIGAFKDRAEVANALKAQLADKTAELDPKTVNMLARLVGASSVGAGAAVGGLAR